MRSLWLTALVGVTHTLAQSLCGEVHGFAGEAGSTFSLANTAASTVSVVVAARSLVPDVVVQTNATVGAQPQAFSSPNGALVLSLDPGTTATISVLRRSSELAPFSFVSYVVGGQVCQLPLTAAPLSLSLPSVNGVPLATTVVAAPAYPNTFFTATFATSCVAQVAYGFSPNVSLATGTPVPLNVPLSGQTSDPTSSVYFAVQGQANCADTVRVSFAWSAAPAGWTAAPAPTSVEDRVAAAAESASSFGSLVFVCFVMFVLYMSARSAYNYNTGTTTFPDYVPHHEFFAGLAGSAQAAVAGVRRHADEAGVRMPTAMPAGAATRRGYESVSPQP